MKYLRPPSKSILIRRIKILFLFIVISCSATAQQYTSAGVNSPTSWRIEVQDPKVFIENRGQFDGRGLKGTDRTLYAANLGTVQIFFSKKGISYCLEKKKKNREEGSHEGKFKFYRDVIQTEWIGANKNTKIIPIDKSPDY